MCKYIFKLCAFVFIHPRRPFLLPHHLNTIVIRFSMRSREHKRSGWSTRLCRPVALLNPVAKDRPLLRSVVGQQRFHIKGVEMELCDQPGITFI